MKIVSSYFLIVSSTLLFLMTIMLVQQQQISAASATMTSSCISAGSASLVTEFPVLGGNSIALPSMDTASVLASRGCSPSYSWKYAAATQPPTLANQQAAFPTTLSTWSVDPLSGSLSFAAGSVEGVNTIVEKLQCYSSANTLIDACVITHQVVVYQNLGVTSVSGSPPVVAPTTSLAPGVTSAPTTSTRAPTTTPIPQVTGNNIGPCSPVYGFYVSTSSSSSTVFTSTLEGFTGETKCPTGLPANYKLVQAPAKQSSTSNFAFASTGAFTYTPADSTKNTYDNDYFRFTKYCGAYLYCSASAYLVLQPKAEPTTAAPPPPVTVGRCPDVYYFTTNQALTLATVTGGFTCPSSVTSPLMMYTTFDTSGLVAISDPSVGSFTVNNNVPFTTSAAGWADFSFNAQCVETGESCIGTGHIMLLPAPATSAPAAKQCQAVYQKWSPTLAAPLTLAQSLVGSAGCVYTVTAQPDFVSIALVPTTGQFTLTFTVANPIGWIMFEFDKSCPATSASDPASATACHGFAYVQAVPATEAPQPPAIPTTISCPALNSKNVFSWTGASTPLSVATTPVISTASAIVNTISTTNAYCSGYALDYDADRPIPPITLSTQSGSFAFSSSAPSGWTNFSYKYSCFATVAMKDNSSSVPQQAQIDCVGNAAVLVGPNAPPTPGNNNGNTTPVCAASPNTAELLFSYVWKVGSTQNIALVDPTGQTCSNFSSFVQPDQSAASTFAVDPKTGFVTLQASGDSLTQGWQNFSLQVSCTAPQTFTCMTRVFVLLLLGPTSEPTPSSSTTTGFTTTSDNNGTTTITLIIPTIAPNNTDYNATTVTIVNPSFTANESTTASNNTDVIYTSIPTTVVATNISDAPTTTTVVVTTTPVPVPSGYLTAFANLECRGTCDQQSWKTISFVPDLWDDTPAGGATLLPNSPVTNPPHIRRLVDARPIDDVAASYDALNAPNILGLSATGAIGNMGARFPTFESLASPTFNASASPVAAFDYGSNTKALPGRLTASNILSVAAATSLPFDVSCFDTQSLFYGVAEQIWAWDDISSLQGHSVPGEYNGGAPNYFHKFGGKHQSCDTMATRPVSCKYAPFLTPPQDTSAANKWSLTVDGCDLTWVASNMDSASILNSFVKKNGVDRVFAPNSPSSANAAQVAQRSGALQTAVLEATVFSEGVKPVSWTSPAKGTLINEKPYAVPVRVTQWVAADRDGKNVHRTSFAVRGLTSVVAAASSSSVDDGPTITFNLDLVAPSSVGAAFVPAVKGVEIDSISSTSASSSTVFNCQFTTSTFNQDDIGSSNLPLPLAFAANASDCADVNQTSPFFRRANVFRISNTIVLEGDASSNTAVNEPVTKFQVQLTLPRTASAAAAASPVFPFEGYVALRLLLSSTRNSDNMWIERYIIRAGTSVTGVDVPASSSATSAVGSAVTDVMRRFDISVCSGNAIVDPASNLKAVVTGEDDTLAASSIPAAQIATLSSAFASASELGQRVCRTSSSSSTSTTTTTTIKDTGAVVAGSDSFTLCAFNTGNAGINVPDFEYIIVSQVDENYDSSPSNNNNNSLYRIAIIAPSSMSTITTKDVLLPWNVVAPFAQVYLHQSNLSTFAPIGVTAVSINNIGSLCPRSTDVQNTKKSCRLRFDIGVKVAGASSSSQSPIVFTRSVFAFVDNTLDNLALNNTATWQATIDQLPAALLVQSGVSKAAAAMQGTSLGYGIAIAIFGAIVLVALVVLYIDKKSAKDAAEDLIINQPKKVAEFIKNFMFSSESVKFKDESEFVRGSDLAVPAAAAAAAADVQMKEKEKNTPKLNEEEIRVPQLASPLAQKNNNNNNSAFTSVNNNNNSRPTSQSAGANDDDDLISASSTAASERHQKEKEEKERKANLLKLKQQLREQQQQKQQSSSTKDPSLPNTSIDDIASPAPTRPSAVATTTVGQQQNNNSNSDDADPLYE